jgi:hypothetical protein
MEKIEGKGQNKKPKGCIGNYLHNNAILGFFLNYFKG